MFYKQRKAFQASITTCCYIYHHGPVKMLNCSMDMYITCRDFSNAQASYAHRQHPFDAQALSALHEHAQNASCDQPGFHSPTRSGNPMSAFNGEACQGAPGGGDIACVYNLSPLIRLVRCVQSPSIRKRLLAIIPARSNQVPVGNQCQGVCVSCTGTRP